MRRVTLLFLLTALVAAPAASAKEVMSVTACGPERCVTSDDEDVTAALMNGGTPSDPRDDASGVVLLRASIGDGTSDEEMATFMSAWEPRSRMLVGEDGTWMRLPGERRRAIADLAGGLGTFPPSVLRRLSEAEIELPTAKPGHAGPPPDVAPAQNPPREPAAPAADTDWVLLLTPAAAALLLGGVLLLRRRRPGDGAPRPATQ